MSSLCALNTTCSDGSTIGGYRACEHRLHSTVAQKCWDSAGCLFQTCHRKQSLPAPVQTISRCRELTEDDALEDGCYVYGLFIDGARWNSDTEVLDDQLPGVMHDTFPLIQFQPCMQPENRVDDYNCPLYKTMARAGVLSSTGGWVSARGDREDRVGSCMHDVPTVMLLLSSVEVRTLFWRKQQLGINRETPTVG